ncbi:unnamed protein product [Leptosia nina]|uniref:Endonuclease/exonuclease/phosphatase domain-containing protein n=1 Tax=Leptosia nina TaxID=320188 RepID=A0AAV1JZZ5_9NEOP
MVSPPRPALAIGPENYNLLRKFEGRLANIKKYSRVKKEDIGAHVPRKRKQMSDSLQPTLHHTSFGGQFQVDEERTYEEWQESTSSSGEPVNPHTGKLPPDFRVWELVESWRSSSTKANTLKIRVVSYNVLAQYLLQSHPYLYTNCKPNNLKWQVRASKLFKEIVHLAPDILCLQEVQASHLNGFYAKFESLGYDGLFKQKRQRDDGCAIYVKKSQFEIQDQNTVEYFQPDMPVLNRDNIALMVKLVPRGASGTPIVVATTHLLYNPKRSDVRLAQIQVLLAEIDRFAYYDNGKECGYLPIILTGDLNSTPGSPVIDLLNQGCVRASSFRDGRSDWRKIGVTDNCQHLSIYLNRQTGEGSGTDFNLTRIYNSDYSMSLPDGSINDETWDYNELFNTDDIGHPLQLNSVYDNIKPDGVPEATTFQNEWVTVDYIYFSKHSSLKLIERLRLPTAVECQSLGSLPNDIYGSDHLAVAATFALTPQTP